MLLLCVHTAVLFLSGAATDHTVALAYSLTSPFPFDNSTAECTFVVPSKTKCNPQIVPPCE